MITAGFDIGTRFVKVCIVDRDGLAGHAMAEVDKNIASIINRVYKKALLMAGARRRKVKRIMATGYGSELVRGSCVRIPEPPCIARAVNKLTGARGIAVDVGGLFINVISFDENGLVNDSITNEKCAAGSGKFLEMVSETLEIPIKKVSDMALQSNSPYVINSQCAVFAESEIISQVNSGRSGADIVSGVLKSIVSRTVTLIERNEPSGNITLCGGIPKLAAFRVMFNEMIGEHAYVPEMDSQLITAYGAALLARGRVQQRKIAPHNAGVKAGAQ